MELTLAGTVEYVPIHFMHKSINFDEMIALYSVSDVCLVSSTRDGMNLVSYEYIATQEERKGSLILSEFTGAAQSLNGSILVNPWNTEELASAIQEAVTMTPEQRTLNYQKLSKYVKKYTRYVCVGEQVVLVMTDILSAFWGASFVAELTRISEHGEKKLKLRRTSMMSPSISGARSEDRASVSIDGHPNGTVNEIANNA